MEGLILLIIGFIFSIFVDRKEEKKVKRKYVRRKPYSRVIRNTTYNYHHDWPGSKVEIKEL